MKTLYITIGNSDDKLSQKKWADFCSDLYSVLVANTSLQDPGIQDVWFSHAADFTQNMCLRAEFPAAMIDGLRTYLAELARKYNQDAIALVVVDSDAVEMIGPETRAKTPRRQREEFQAKQGGFIDYFQRSADRMP